MFSSYTGDSSPQCVMHRRDSHSTVLLFCSAYDFSVKIPPCLPKEAESTVSNPADVCISYAKRVGDALSTGC